MNIKNLNFENVKLNIIDTSIHKHQKDVYAMGLYDNQKYLILLSDKAKIEFEVKHQIKVEEGVLYILPKTAYNANLLKQKFEWLKPQRRGKRPYSIGLGDRLGIATKGHIAAVENTNFFPVLAQQSIRELSLTNRTYTDVINAATWTVFELGYKNGFGADGDHLKYPHEIEYALSQGCSMITLDSSEYINNTYNTNDLTVLEAKYNVLDDSIKSYYETTYLNKLHQVNDLTIHFTKETLLSSVLIYQEAIVYIEYIYHQFIKGLDVDFEISIDETDVPTTPENHYFIANELKKRGIKITTLAPRFVGEFQKAIDYIGDLSEFETGYIKHEHIAEHFGYYLSIHSGSDKFGVFPIIGRISKRGFHVKTAGTNWLEALKVIEKVDPKFFKELYEFSLTILEKAKKYYHINADEAVGRKLLENKSLEALLMEDDSRQILHVTYGLILNNIKDNRYKYKEQLKQILEEHLSLYTELLKNHIGKHIQLLMSKQSN